MHLHDSIRYAVLVLVVQAWVAEAAPVMRRGETTQAQLTAGGALQQVHDDPAEATAAPAATAATAVAVAPTAATITGEVPCNEDYPKGEEGAFNCTSEGHEDILTQDLCMLAAREAGASTDAGFMVDVAFWQKRPMKCFHHSCAANAERGCYYYNPTGNVNHGIVNGTPVCQRKRFVNGTVNADGTATCPTGYSLVNDYNFCPEVASCFADTDGNPMNVGTLSNNNEVHYPMGCFINHADGKVYFNDDTGGAAITNPAGTPLCNVTDTTVWGNGHGLH